ncbi:hypothetical protein U27_01745 [Candidatus Vecturithrix granuli]|uniref:Uncharacterized protein n=1 Tax=Vecturithrix granuli TaxID=1499967 RepID=A0A0S6W923_VECG1|nr:hypothetical protein U27_01745 [Candidatus Vecturithrix granuli]
MEAIRILTTVKDNGIALELPISFENKEVEVIVLPLDSSVHVGSVKKEEFLRFLKDGPTLSDEELHRIDAVKKEFRHWTFDEY